VVLVLRDFALTRLENLHHFSNWRDNLRFNAICIDDPWSHSSSGRLAGSDVTITPSVTCMDWLRWWYNCENHLVSSSTALAFLTNISEKRKSVSPSAIQVKNRRKTIGTEEKFDVMCRLEKCERIVDLCRNLDSLILAYIQFLIMLIELKKVLSVWLCSKTTTVLSEWTAPKNYGCESLTFLLH
jgi:hypothetical protein